MGQSNTQCGTAKLTLDATFFKILLNSKISCRFALATKFLFRLIWSNVDVCIQIMVKGKGSAMQIHKFIVHTVLPSFIVPKQSVNLVGERG